SLTDHWQSNLPRPFQGLAFARENALWCRQDRHAGILHCRTSFFLLPHQTGDFRWRSNEFDIAGLGDFGEIGIFCEQPVTRMDGVDISDFGSTDDSGDVQVALPKLRRADADGFVGKPDRQRVAVGLAVDRHRADSELFAGADDTKGNLASIGDEYLLEHA